MEPIPAAAGSSVPKNCLDHLFLPRSLLVMFKDTDLPAWLALTLLCVCIMLNPPPVSQAVGRSVCRTHLRDLGTCRFSGRAGQSG